MEISFNNSTQQVPDHSSVQGIINTLLGSSQKGIAVAVNEAVIPKVQWESYVLQPADKVLVIKATQGG